MTTTEPVVRTTASQLMPMHLEVGAAVAFVLPRRVR